MLKRCSWKLTPNHLPIIRTKGIYPTWAPRDQLTQIHRVFQTQISEIHSTTSSTIETCVRPPLLEKGIQHPTHGWPESKEEQKKIFAHLFPGDYLVDTDLEGFQYGPMASYFKAWLNHFQLNSSSQEIKRFSETMIPLLDSLLLQQSELNALISKPPSFEALQAFADQCRTKVLTQMDGKPYLMLGGWNKKPKGHGILYEFTKRGDLFDIYLFNTGAGTSFHSSLVQGTKEKIDPILFIRNVPIQSLTTPFFQALVELQVLSLWRLWLLELSESQILARDDTPKFLYTLFNSLGGKRETPDSGLLGYVTAQRAGTCIANSLLAYFRFKSPSLEFFEQMRLNILSGTLLKAWDSWKGEIETLELLPPLIHADQVKKENPIHEISEYCSLLEQSARMLISHSVKPHFLKKKGSWFSKMETITAQTISHEVLFNTRLFQNQWRLKASQTLDPLQWTDRLEDRLASDEKMFLYFLKLRWSFAPLPQTPQSLSVSLLQTFENRTIPPAEMGNFLKKQSENLKSDSTRRSDEELQAQIQWLADSLPIPSVRKDDYWSQVPQETILVCMESIDQLAATYYNRFKSDAIGSMPEQQNVIFTFMAIQHALAIQYEEKVSSGRCILSEYQILDPTKYQEEDPYLVFFNPQVLKRREEIQNYFSQFNQLRVKEPILHEFNKAFAPFPSDSEKLRPSLICREELKYYERLGARMSTEVNVPFYPSSFYESFSQEEIKAITILLDPRSFYLETKKKHLGFLRNCAFYSFLSANNFSSAHTIEETLDNSFRNIGQVKWIRQYYPENEYWAGFVFSNREGKRLASYLPKWNQSSRLHTQMNHLVVSSQEKGKGSYPIREAKEYALRPKLKTEQVSLPDVSLRNVQEPLARPLHVLNEAEHSIHSFKDPKVRDLFLIDLFRSDLLNPLDNHFTTPFQLLCEDPKFVQRCADFIEKGVQYYWSSCEKSNRDLLTTLYFIRLGQLILPWLSKRANVPKIFDQKMVREWILQVLASESTLLPEQRLELRIDFLLSYEHMPVKQITDSEWETIVTFWFSLDRNINTNPNFNCYSIFKVTEQMLRYLPYFYNRLQASTQLQNRIGTAICKMIKPTITDVKWEFRNDVGLLYGTSQTDEVCIDLQGRSLLVNGSNTYQSLSLPESMKNIEGRARLFQNRSPSLYVCSKNGNNETYTFEDPIWGSIEMSARPIHPSKNPKGYIVRTDNSSRRYLHCSDLLNDLSKQVPLSIRYQSVLWLPLQERSMEVDLTQPCLLTDPKTGKVLYQLTKEKGITRDGELYLTTHLAPLVRIESQDVVLCWKHETEGMASIEYPFYFSMDGQPLCFDFATDIKSKKRLPFWRENPEYVLAQDQPLGLVGYFSQYIVLEHLVTKKKKLIIPCIKLSKQKKLSQYPSIERLFKYVNPEGIIIGDEGPIDPKAQVLGLDLIDGKLKPHSPIEKLFLSYLHLAERNYSQSLEYLEDIPLFNPMSKAEWDCAIPILEWMVQLEDHSVDANAILLRSHALIRELINSPENFLKETDKETFLKSMKRSYVRYLEGSNHGLSLLELPQIEEKRWRNIMLDARLPLRSFIRSHSIDDTQSITPHITKVPKDIRSTPLNPHHAAHIRKLSDLEYQPQFLTSTQLNYYWENFYGIYNKILNSSPIERENILHHLWCHRTLALALKDQAPLNLDLLIGACLVDNPENLVKPYSSYVPQSYEEASNHFKRIEKSIWENLSHTKWSALIRSSDQSFVPSSTETPLHSLRLEFSEKNLVSLDRGVKRLDLENISLPRIDFASNYLETKPRTAIEEHFNTDSDWGHLISLGKEVRKNGTRYHLKQNAHLQHLKTELQNLRQKVISETQLLEDAILSQGYPRARDMEMRKKEAAIMLSGQYPFTHSISSLIGLFLDGTYETFARALPQCSSEEIVKINSDLQKFLVQKAFIQQLDRALQKVDPLLEKKEMDSATIHELGLELFTECSFESTWRPGLVFEYVSDKRLRPKQVTYLRNIISQMKGDHPFVLTHMIMGGGKTDVFASLLGRLWAKKDQLSLFLTPGSQLKTVQGNLAASQWKHFRQGVCTFDYSRQELTLDILKYIHSRLVGALEREEMVLLKSEMPQILELEYAYLVCQPDADEGKIQVLKDILTLFRTKTCVIVDETDEVLRVDRETNFPSGERISPQKNRVGLIAFLYQKLASDPYVLQRLHLIDNEQELMSEKIYKEELLPFLAKVLISHPVFIQLPPELKESFERYLSDQIDPNLEDQVQKTIFTKINASYHQLNDLLQSVMNPLEESQTRTSPFDLRRLFRGTDQSKDSRLVQQLDHSVRKSITPVKTSEKFDSANNLDLRFLKWRDQMERQSPEVAHLMGLGRHLLQDILPLTLRKKTDRNYGRKRMDRGKIVPYVATNIPGSTEYGNPWELIAYHFQTAISTSYSKELISHFIQIQRQAIRQEAISYGVDFSVSPLAKQFEHKFGMPIQDITDIDQLTALINRDITKKLYVEETLIAKEVTYDPHYYSSNGHNLMMFPKTMIMTGTPYNRRSYPLQFSQKPLLDPGSEGALIDLLIERKGELHRVSDSGDITEILKEALKSSKHAKKIRAVIDVGGCLLKKDNEGYARDILSMFANNPSINGVVFFRMIRDKEGMRKDLVLLKKGQNEPIVLKDTHVSTWKAQGVDPGSLFFLYDQWHARGTDFPLPPESTAITILGEQDALHDVLQGVARLRKLDQKQDVIYAISESVIQKIETQEGISKIDIQTILERSHRIEQEKLRDHIFRHYIHELHNIVRFEHLQTLLCSRSKERVKGDRTLLMVSQEESLYKSFGKLKKQVSPIVFLKQMADALNRKYRKKYPSISAKFLKTLNAARSELKHLPTLVSSSQQTLGREQERQVVIEKQQENQHEIELQKEWNSYQDPPKGEVVNEKPWDLTDADSLKDQTKDRLQLHLARQEIKTLESLLTNYGYANPFPSIFDMNLFATQNWNTSHTTPVSIFNRMHKPPQQLLVIEHGSNERKTVSGVLLSLAESEFFRLQWFPKQRTDLRMWLIDANGHCLNRTETPLPQTQAMDDLLIQMNLLNGHGNWLIENIGKSLIWFYKDPKLTKLKFHFLHLQARRHLDQEKMALLLAHPMLKYHPDGIEGLIHEETLGLVTQELLPYVPKHLRNHTNLPSDLKKD